MGKRYTLAEKLRDALQHSDTQYTDSTDDSYAVDISISGSRTDADEGIRFVYITIVLIVRIVQTIPVTIFARKKNDSNLFTEYDEVVAVVSF